MRRQRVSLRSRRVAAVVEVDRPRVMEVRRTERIVMVAVVVARVTEQEVRRVQV